MAHLVEDITKFFVFEDIDIDNWHFKLYSKGCVILFFAGSMVGVMSQYFGEPIQCDFKGIDGETAKDYCWIHGSSYIPPEYQMHMKCIADLEGVESKDDAPDTSYYQWVTFMMLLQAGMFMLPPRIWRTLEGKLIESFGMEGKSVVMLTEEAKYEDGVVMEVVVEKFVKYFTTVLHHNQRYFANFLMCECLNFFLIFFNFWATDQFLQGRFRYYGLQVIHYYSMTKAERIGSINPFCAAFPKENVINEKIYLALWFYLVFCMMCSLGFAFYRVATVFFEPIRFYAIYLRIGHKYDSEIRTSLRFVLERCYLGDWFVLQQLCRNVNIYFFREFVKQLKKEMVGHPKGHMRDKRMVLKGYKDRHPSQYFVHPETRMDHNNPDQHALIPADKPERERPATPESEETPQKSNFFLRIEHEQRLMPGRRGRRSGRGKGSGVDNRGKRKRFRK